MEYRKFSRINNIVAAVVFAVASLVYLLTIEPTASFWDCGEFIASSYKLEVGHPPGNPVFQIIARIFTLFADQNHAAMMINAMSALCSSLTIMFLYLTIVHFARRISSVKKTEPVAKDKAVAILAAGVVGAMAYCFSDTFWFSAVEAEVYAMSSLFTAVVVWCMLKWEEEADSEYANRWIVLIALLMGLSIGVHLLNLLTIPALVFIYYYKKFKVTTWGSIRALLVSGGLLAVILFLIIPYVPKTAAFVDRIFVNSFGLPFNSGALFFVILLFVLSFGLVYWSYRKKKVLLNTVMLCFTMILLGYSVFSVVVIRASANTPTNENAPDNPYSLVSYIGREQYGRTPLLYGQTYATPYSVETTDYYTKLGDRYIKAQGPLDSEFDQGGQVLFPRMWSSQESHMGQYARYVKSYPGQKLPPPSAGENMAFFMDYQVGWMYIRYFMWNFVGRQNDLQGSTAGDLSRGNWESGFSDLGGKPEGPDYIVDSTSRNHYYFLPLILGLIGLIYHLWRDQRNWWITMLLFLLTGIAIVLYLNQTPLQARERDYAYAGSFYAFTIWIGLAVMAFFEWFSKLLKKGSGAVSMPAAVIAALICLPAPVLMAAENWDDHDRSHRTTARDMAVNYLESCGENAILVTHGDNDTFPLWYAQEVEGVRTDIRVLNTSLAQTDWYLDQMKCKQYESDPLPITLNRADYLYGTNEYIEIYDLLPAQDQTPIADVMKLFKEMRPDRRELNSGAAMDIRLFPTRTFSVPVNKENAIKAGLVPAGREDEVPDSIVLNIPASKNYLSKLEMVLLDILANYQWDRPICLVQMGGDVNIGLKDYLRFDGFVYTFIPFKGTMSMAEGGYTDVEKMYDLFMHKYALDNLASEDIHVDYQNLYTFNGTLSVRNLFAQTAEKMFATGDTVRTVELLDRMQSVMNEKNFPLTTLLIPSYNLNGVSKAIVLYYRAGEIEKGRDLARRFLDSVDEEMNYLIQSVDLLIGEQYSIFSVYQCMWPLIQVFADHGETELYGRVVRTQQLIEEIDRNVYGGSSR